MNGATWFFVGFGSALLSVGAAWFAWYVGPLESRRYESASRERRFIRIVGEGQSFDEDDWSVLAAYNAEIARGIAHTPEWDDAMAGMQLGWDLIHGPLRSRLEPDSPPKAGEPTVNLLEERRR